MKKAGTVIQIASAVMFVSSFFVEDNKKATRRRWLSLGIFTLGYGIQLAGHITANAKTAKAQSVKK